MGSAAPDPCVVMHHPDCRRHEMTRGHPEQPARVDAVAQALGAAPFAGRLAHLEASPATRASIARVHDPRYVDGVFEQAPAHGLVHLDPDTAMNPHSLSAALRAAGAVVEAVDRVLDGRARTAFCNVRPPGHHAERARAMGFCLFDNIAVGAAHAIARHGLERVAIVDFDVHHGNGTEDIFRTAPHVLLCSSFQHPFYPYSGADTVSDHILNVPLPSGTDGERFRPAVAERWLDALDNFAPQIVMFSAGFDAHLEDPLGSFRLVEDDFAWLTREVMDVAGAHAHGRVVSVLEGGYNLAALGRSAVAHVGALLT